MNALTFRKENKVAMGKRLIVVAIACALSAPLSAQQGTRHRHPGPAPNGNTSNQQPELASQLPENRQQALNMQMPAAPQPQQPTPAGQMPGMQHPMPQPAQQPPVPGQMPGMNMPLPPTRAPAQGGPALSLEQLEQMAMQSNPTLAQAQSEVRVAAGRAKQAGLYPNPTVGYDSDEFRGGFVNGGQQGFFVQQEIVLGGKLGLSRRVFEEERKQAEVERDEQRLRVQNGVRLLFYQALVAQETVQLRSSLVALANDAVSTAKQLFNVGQADQPDVLQAEVEVDQETLALVAAQQNQRRAWTELAAAVGRPELPLSRLQGNLEEVVEVNPDQWLQTLLKESPAVKIAALGIQRAQAQLARARREPIPNLQLRGGARNNLELIEPLGRPIGWEGFAEVGVQLPIFNRNQGNVEVAKADVERAKREQRRVELLLRQRSAMLFQNYLIAQDAVQRYRTQMIPRAEQAYKLYLQKYSQMTAAYPQVLVSQRTLFQLQTDYIAALEALWTNSIVLRGFLLSDPLEAPARAGETDRPVREVNVPSPMSPASGMSQQ